MKDRVKQHDYDLVHAHWVVPNGLIANAAALDIPVAVGLHGSDVFLAERSGVRTLVKSAMSRTRLLTGCSPELVDRICAIGFDRRRSRVIPYGVDTDQFSPDPERRSIWRERLGIPAEATIALGVGRMVTKKGFHVLLEVMPQILERLPQTHLILGGEGDRLDEFKRTASDWQGRIHFPGVILRDTLPDLYRCADLFVLPAVHDSQGNVDGLPNVILEAMASGLPVVASRISGIPLAITDEVEGLLVPESEPAALEAALTRALTELPTREHWGSAARQKAVTELTWRAVAERYRQAYKDALAGFPDAAK